MKFLTGVTVVAALALLGCGGAPAGSTTISNGDPTAAAEVRMEWRPRQVGDTITKVDDRMLRMRGEITPGQLIDFGQTKQAEQHQEVLAVVDGVESTVKVHYPRQRIVETVQGSSRDKPTPTLGKTYLVSRVAGKLVVTRDDGSAPSADEVKEVSNDHDSFGKPAAMEQFLASVRWKVGVEVTPDAAQLAAIGDSMSDDGAQLRAMRLTLRHADDETATFAMVFTLAAASEDGNSLAFELSGTAVVERATGRPRVLEATGTVSGTIGPAHAKLDGTITSKEVYTYGPGVRVQPRA